MHCQGWIGPGTTWGNEMNLGWNIAPEHYRSLDLLLCSPPRYQVSTLLKGAAVYLAILFTLCLASQWSHLVQLLLKMYTKQLLEWVWVWFVLFYDTSSQKGYSMPSMTILFLNLQIIRSDIRPDIKWAVSLVIAYGHFNLPQGIVWVCMSSHTHFITPIGTDDTPDETHVILFFSKCICNVFMPIKK